MYNVRIAVAMSSPFSSACFIWHWKYWEKYEGASDEMEAPESLNSSEPIWIGKTRSWGRILGILLMSWGVDWAGVWLLACIVFGTGLGCEFELDMALDTLFF